MKQNKFFVGVYCPPQRPTKGYPSRVTEESFRLLAEAGVTDIYGYYESESGEKIERAAFEVCAKYGLKFYPRDLVFDKYLALEGAIKKEGRTTAYANLSESAKGEVDAEFLTKLLKWAKYPSFGGVFFGDETGILTFEGMAEGYKVFKKACPDKEFHYNALNYCLDDKAFFYGYYSYLMPQPYPELEGELAAVSKNRFRRYEKYINAYLDTVGPDMLSADMYPFVALWKEIKKPIHRGLYETCSFFSEKKKKYGVKTFYYIQTGRWGTESSTIERAEIALQESVTLAYGLDGFVYFPGCFPNDFLDSKESAYKDGEAGLLDINGKPTRYWQYSKSLVAHYQACAPYMIEKEWLGVMTVGKFEGGIPEGLDVLSLQDGDCIYTGWLPKWGVYNDTLPEMETSSQLLVGVFKDGDKQNLFIVNNSVVTDVSFTVKTKGVWTAIIDGEKVKGKEKFSMQKLNPGESVLLSIK